MDHENNDKEIDINLKYLYPFLSGSDKEFEQDLKQEPDLDKKQNETNLINFINNKFREFPNLFNDLVKILKLSLDKMESGFVIPNGKYNIVLFYMLKMIIAAFNNKNLDNHVANFMSKIYYDTLQDKTDQNIQNLCEAMSINCKYLDLNKQKLICGSRYMFSMYFIDFMTLSKSLNDSDYALINQYLEKGFVYLRKHIVIRLLQERIRLETIPKRVGSMSYFAEIIKNVNKIKDIWKILDDKLEQLNSQSRKTLRNNNEDFGNEERPKFDEFPPCIKYILDKASNSENLTHSERLHIAFFYANTNFSVEETIDVFRTLPDFNEEKTRYNVEFSRGINGKGKSYKTFNCAKLKTDQLCKGNDKVYGCSICEKGVIKKDKTNYHIKSPLEFMFWYRVEKNRKK